MGDVMTTRTDHELTEARALVRELARAELRNDGDRRFLETRRSCLDHTGEAGRIGRFRLASLRRVAADYGIGRADEAPAASPPGFD
jgi:hypothetical protein